MKMFKSMPEERGSPPEEGVLSAIAVESFSTAVTIKVDKQRCPSSCVMIVGDTEF